MTKQNKKYSRLTRFRKKNHPLLPPDYTKEEYLIIMHAIAQIYSQFSDEDKFIICSVFECGYKHWVVADILGKERSYVSHRIRTIRQKLSPKTHQKVSVEL